MKLIAEGVEMLAAFDPQGRVRPMKFKWTADGETQVVHVDRVLCCEVQKIAGTTSLLFSCRSLIDGRYVHYQLKLDTEQNRWLLFLTS